MAGRLVVDVSHPRRRNSSQVAPAITACLISVVTTLVADVVVFDMLKRGINVTGSAGLRLGRTSAKHSLL